ncbi:MAG: DAK2 domain-containing protein [Actinomycetota bacterium]|nr:DAK2 domain-containing protein [Actinomycetota bacterium]
MAEALARLGPEELGAAVRAFRDCLRRHQERLNRLNVYPVPDGDTGTNMALTLESVVAELDGASDMAGCCAAVIHGSLMGARGNSGVILSQILRGIGDRLKEDDAAGPEAVAEALTAGSAAAYKAVMKPVEGTILTVARDAAEAASGASGGSLLEVLEAAAAAARASVTRTPELLPVLAAAGVVDAGGAGFVLLLDALLHVVDGRPLPEPPDTPALSTAAPRAATERAEEEVGADGGRYEVMYLLDAPDDRIDGFKAAWEPIGDSIVVVGGDGLWNCHIHTDDIGAAVEAALDAGRPRQIRVTDLANQIQEERWVRQGLPGPPEPEARPHTATAVVAVAAGKGVADALRSLGAQEVVAGGQSANPSTREILEAVEATAADGVIVLPNNKNVVPVAEGVPELATRPVQVVPTTGLVGGLAALVAYDPHASMEVNAAAMAEAAEHVVSGEVTRAVRAASTPVGDVREGDWLGLAGDAIVLVRPDLAGAATALLDRLVTEAHELVTVIEGQAASAEVTDAVSRWLADERPGVEVQVHAWGHPHAAYVFSIE